jgi:hypothetical protein
LSWIHRFVMPAKAGIQFTGIAEYWIIRFRG